MNYKQQKVNYNRPGRQAGATLRHLIGLSTKYNFRNFWPFFLMVLEFFLRSKGYDIQISVGSDKPFTPEDWWIVLYPVIVGCILYYLLAPEENPSAKPPKKEPLKPEKRTCQFKEGVKTPYQEFLGRWKDVRRLQEKAYQYQKLANVFREKSDYFRRAENYFYGQYTKIKETDDKEHEELRGYDKAAKFWQKKLEAALKLGLRGIQVDLLGQELIRYGERRARHLAKLKKTMDTGEFYEEMSKEFQKGADYFQEKAEQLQKVSDNYTAEADNLNNNRDSNSTDESSYSDTESNSSDDTPDIF